MSAATSLLSEDQFLCSICLDVFTDPVSTPCGHNFCKNCISEHWNIAVQCQCPICKTLFYTKPELQVNIFISEMVDRFRQSAQQRASSSRSEQQAAKSGEVPCDVCTGTKLKAVKSCLVCLVSYCETHLEPHLTASGLKRHELIDPVENLEGRICTKHDKALELFCKDDQKCVCMLCTILDHKAHEVVPLKKEYLEKKSKLEKTETEIQQMIQKRRLKIQEIKQSVKLSKENADKEIAEDVQAFTKLKDFPSLNTAPPSKDWTDVKVCLPSHDGTVKTVVAQLVERLKKMFTYGELMWVKQYAVDVTLDPDTANPNLILSDDGKQVHHDDAEKNLPDNPERFSIGLCVLGKQIISSGRFYFEVQVKEKMRWDLGVARESINRKGLFRISCKNGYWTVSLRNEKYFAFAESPVRLSLKSKPQKVGVFVDYEEGLVSFYDVDASALIYSYTGCSFNEKLLPFFCPCSNQGGKNSTPLIISPVQHTE
ncbi:zinc-binding protein A33-like [Thunnus maccoyii]|uniref:zinc-binding protein A33-like n=1 Tax=Thunnus maccoyii TaxID=8240 RepID=UPI001C4D8C51|nr:zinc-binding protein A33-like [Thunnus maccoyii]